MGLFGRKKKTSSADNRQDSEAFNVAEQVIEQSIALFQAVIDHMDGSNSKEREMVSDAREQLSNMKGLQKDLRSGSTEPGLFVMLGIASTFSLGLNIVNSLDASTAAESELVHLAKQLLRDALEVGYAPAVDLYNKGQLPIW